MKVDTLNVSNLTLMTVPTITNKNIKKICMENAMYLLSFTIENVYTLSIKNINFFICTVDEQKSFLKLQKKSLAM
jgi:hypothetical protein